MTTTSSDPAVTPIALLALNVHGSSLASGKVARLRAYTANDRASFLCLQECGTTPPIFPNCLHSPLGTGLAILHWGYYPQRIVWSTPFALFALFSASPLPDPPPHSLLVVGSVHLSCSDTDRCQQLTDLSLWLHDVHRGSLLSPPLYFGGDFNTPLSALDSEFSQPPHTTHGRSPALESQLLSQAGLCDAFRHLHPSQRTYTHFKNHTHTLLPLYTARRLDRWYTSTPPPYSRLW